MKKYQTVERRKSSDESQPDGAPLIFRFRHASTLNPQPSTLSRLRAFTLIELLVVIAIMGTLAALIFPVVGAVKKHQYIYNTQTQMAQLETAIDNYKAAYGFYPPSPSIPPTTGNPPTLVNQLYYELTGTTNIGSSAAPVYQPLVGGRTLTANDVSNAFAGAGGFINCSKKGSGEDASVARNFLPELKPDQIAVISNYTVPVTILIGSVGGPDAKYQPLGQQDLNPWRYNSLNPTNNPGSYELWIQLSIGAATNISTHTYGPLYLICNWTKQVQINSPLP